MDLYSSSRRYASPFYFTEGSHETPLPISARGLIGDGDTAALVAPDGSIDWLCFPRFDSPSVFGAIVDRERGGLTAMRPAAARFESIQAYDPDTNVLETLFTVPSEGILRMTDFMPWTDDPRQAVHEVHRRIECRAGRVEVEVIFDPRFDYGRATTKIEYCEHGLRAHDGQDSLVAVLGSDAKWEPRPEGGAVARFTLQKGEHAWMVLSWDAPIPAPLGAYRPFERLRSTREEWRNWARKLDYHGPFRHHVMRSALALKLMVYGPTGAMVAAPTTSLPEWLGGGRNWDYRYTWTRDTAMSIRACNRIGYAKEARDFFHFMRGALASNPELQVMYTVTGEPVPEEQILSHLRGFAGSAPVRIGNGAKDQVQLDTAGALIDAAFLYEQTGGNIGLRTWRHLSEVIRSVASNWHRPDHGIWEPRNGVQHNVHSKLMSWLALDRGQKLADRFGDVGAEQFGRSASLVRTDLLSHGLDSSGSHFVSRYGGNDVDGALLLLPLSGFLPPTDPRVLGTMDAVRSRLGQGPYIYRYHADDGVGGSEGAFVLCGFWLADGLARAGRLEEAQEIFTAHADASNHLGLLGEEIDPTTHMQLGNFPQGFSHLGLINAAIGIDRELRSRAEAPSLGDPER